jgi:hypothetical protein
MPSFLDLLVVIGMMFLRIGVPILVVALIAVALKRLDARWEREAGKYATRQPKKGVAAPIRKPQPQPQPQVPFIPPAAIKDNRIQPGVSAGVAVPAPIKAAPATQACWDAKGCSPAAQATCSAPAHPDMPCWQARFEAEGSIPADCANCDVFQRSPKH